jgi:hypothetical protein
MSEPIDDFPPGIGNPARNALHNAGYRRLADLVGVPPSDLAALHGVGPKALRLLSEALSTK